MYQNERLTWFEEGNAEFFAGATRLDSVVPRKSIIAGYLMILQNVIQHHKR